MVLLTERKLILNTVEYTLKGVEQALERYIDGATLFFAPAAFESPTILEKELYDLAQNLNSRLFCLTLSKKVVEKRRECILADCLLFPYYRYPNPLFVPYGIFVSWDTVSYEEDPLKRAIRTIKSVFSNGAKYAFLPFAVNDIKRLVDDEGFVSHFLSLLKDATDLDIVRIDSRSGRGNHFLVGRF
ncbi:MAG: hypothetical protein QW818_02985 [Candidatus Aenigmatarchaeota archaeon]|nr:hypothetical protein [Candidatus Aenigmarchaeota archaeon]